ncbi:MAG: hypothetical protein QXI19_13305 [Candidatus Caldarchaeum sp.]
MMKFLLNRWKYRRRLTPVESWVIAQIADRLSDPTKTLLLSQVEQFRRVYRDFGTGEVLLYRYREEEIPPFPNRRSELKWLTLTLRFGQNAQERGQVQVWLVRGYLFSLHFLPPTLMKMSPDSFIVDKLQFHADVMVAQETEEEPAAVEMAPPAGLPEWLGQLGQVYPLTGLLAPRDAAYRTRRLAEMEVRLPDDYLALIEMCEGFMIGEVAVLGLSEAYSVALSDGNYWIIAVCGAEFLAVKEGEAAGTVYYLHHEYLQPQASFSNFEQALRYLLSRGGSS